MIVTVSLNGCDWRLVHEPYSNQLRYEGERCFHIERAEQLRALNFEGTNVAGDVTKRALLIAIGRRLLSRQQTLQLYRLSSGVLSSPESLVAVCLPARVGGYDFDLAIAHVTV